ncbi:unnamed protein product [Cylicocyclus nassatus]|uniref:Uncharacterized protein n=1 Tax=Cylicocyclus nassatus TaxID=53992 RepID=A0AA36GLZ5_CYLNA|nr:unnamed protein product [Cylicocyclus nassatus]
MRILSTTIFLYFIVIFLAVVVNSFKVPPGKGQCYVPKGGNCYRCDCMKPAKCYKGECR